MMKAAILLLSLAAPASAIPLCGPTEQMFSGLAAEYGEEAAATGTAGDVTMTVWSNATTGTWTITLTKGLATCIRASGGAFTLVPLKPNL